MAIAFNYTPATNKTVVTGGTSGVPALFADFVTADRLGSYIVMDAIATANNLTFDRLIRPVEFRALKITFTLAGTNAGAGDTVDITGTDAWGNAQNESINVAAGNGAYASAKYWRTITDIDCTGFADGVGTISASQSQWGVIWDYGNGQYQIDARLDIGDDLTPTFFKTLNESVFFNNCFFHIFTNATFQSGDYTDGQPINGSYVKIVNAAWWDLGAGANRGKFNAYASLFHFNNNQAILFKNLMDWNKVVVILHSTCALGTNFYQANSMTDVTHIYGGASFATSPAIFKRYIHDRSSGWAGISTLSTSDMTVLESQITNDAHATYRWRNSASIGMGLILRNPITKPTQATCQIDNNGRFIREEYSCNIHIADKNGVDLQNATVDCEDQFGTPVFSVNTDANGNIAEQWISRHLWEDIAETETEYSPHKFTISKAGYETMVLDAVTVDGVIDWHLELLDELAEGDVRDGIAYGEDSEGNLELPVIGDVEGGVGFGSNGAEFTGTFKAPAEEDVEVGVKYGAGGAEFEGTYLGLKGNNLVAYLQKRVDLVGYLQNKVSLTGELKS